ncbi:unnamed protein product, partial [Rotaria magnacalcarata]
MFFRTLEVESRCSGGLWAIQNITIGSFTIAWRYNDIAKTVQFIVEGQVVPGINLTSTYIAIGWSDTETTMNNMDVAIFFPGVQLLQD